MEYSNIRSFFRKSHYIVSLLEPWGILLAVIGLGFTVWSFQIEREDREEDRINRAIGQFSSGLGRPEAFSVLRRNNASFYYLDMSSSYLEDQDFSNIRMFKTSLDESILEGSKFFRSSIQESNVTKSELSYSNFISASVTGTDFRRSNFSESSIIDSNFSGSKINSTNFSNVKVLDSNFSHVSFSGADLSRSYFRTVNFNGAKFIDTNLESTNIVDSKLSGAKFYRIDLTNISFNITDILDHESALYCQVIMPDQSLCNRDCEIISNKPKYSRDWRDTRCKWFK